MRDRTYEDSRNSNKDGTHEQCESSSIGHLRMTLKHNTIGVDIRAPTSAPIGTIVVGMDSPLSNRSPYSYAIPDSLPFSHSYIILNVFRQLAYIVTEKPISCPKSLLPKIPEPSNNVDI